MGNDRIIPLFIPFLGCGKKCIYCNQPVITSQSVIQDDLELRILQAEKHAALSKGPFQIGIYGGTFLNIEKTVFRKIWMFLNKVSRYSHFQGIRFSTSPESVARSSPVIRDLMKFGIRLVELGIQTFDETVLAAIGRGTTSRDIHEAIATLDSMKLKYAYQLMPGLPFERFDDFYERCSHYLTTCRPDSIRIYPLLVFKDTELEKMYVRKEYTPLNMEECVFQVKLLYLLARNNGIKILKIGLHPEQSVFENCIAGPLSGHLKELVKGSIIVDWIIEKCSETARSVDIRIHPRGLSWLKADRCSVMDRLNDRGICWKIRGHEPENINFIILKLFGDNDSILFDDISADWDEICHVSRRVIEKKVVLREG